MEPFHSCGGSPLRLRQLRESAGCTTAPRSRTFRRCAVPYDVQRDLTFYGTVVAFRNAVERMQVRRGTTTGLDPEHWWWGFGYLGWPRAGFAGDDRHDGPDPDDLAGSGVPKRPFGGAGAAGAGMVPQAEDEEEVLPIRRIPA